MFWRRKKITFGERKNRRAHYRVRPLASESIPVRTRTATGWVLDISAGGMSFETSAAIKNRAVLRTVVELPGGKEINGLFEVLRVSLTGIVSGRFFDLTPDQVEAIHQYAWRVQRILRGRARH